MKMKTLSSLICSDNKREDVLLKYLELFVEKCGIFIVERIKERIDMAILFLLICILAPIIVYGAESSLLFIASINTILYLVTIFAIPNIIAYSAMRKHKTRVEEAHQQGATKEAMESILNDDVEILEEEYQAVPNWLYYISIVNFLLAVIFCVWGVFQIF